MGVRPRHLHLFCILHPSCISAGGDQRLMALRGGLVAGWNRALEARQRMGAARAHLAIHDASSDAARHWRRHLGEEEGDNGLGRKMSTSGDNKVPDMEMLLCHVCHDPNFLPLLLN